MPNIVQAEITNAGHTALAKSFGGPSGGFSYSYGNYFKIGVDGYIIVSGQKYPMTPDPTLTDIISSTSGDFWYRSTFSGSNLLFISPSTIQFQCFLNLTMANGNPVDEPDTASNVDGPKNSSTLSGAAPEFFEVGLFDENNNMVAYGTFPQETKTNAKTLNHLVALVF